LALLIEQGGGMKEFSRNFLASLPRRMEKLDVKAFEIKRNFVLMALFLECGGEPGLRKATYDLVIHERLLDCHPETIANELPRLVDGCREMQRQLREDELRRAPLKENHDDL
jgi:hypothetical protein